MKRGAHKILVIDDDKTAVATVTAVLRAAGAAAVLAKPVNSESLKEAVAELLPDD